MFGGSVRDRIKAAEAAESSGKHHSHHHHSRRGHKLALNTDEHIKEEFLRRGDGGWSKNVDIGQQEAYVPPASVPFIKVTLETPVVESHEPKIPGKLPKSAFEVISEEHEGEGPTSPSAAKAPATSAAPSKAKGKEKEIKIEDTEEPKVTEKERSSKREPAIPTIDPAKRECHPEYAEDTLHTKSKSKTHRRSSSKQPRVDDYDDAHSEADHSSTHDSVDFHDVHWDGSHTPTKVSSKHSHRRSSARGERSRSGERTPRAHSRSSRSKSTHHEHHEHHEHSEDHKDHEHHKRHSHHSHSEAPSSPSLRRSSSRTGSTHKHGSEPHHSPPSSARHSSHTLWPSFSQTERRSVSDVLETGSVRSKSPRPRPTSIHSTGSVRTERSESSKAVELAEYFAGQKLEHVHTVPLSPPLKERPLGFVRSKSSTGEYTEYFTRDKRILRKPDDDEVFEWTDDHNARADKPDKRHDSHGAGDRKKHEQMPWQAKLMQGIAKHS